jgi:hypothetical protein
VLLPAQVVLEQRVELRLLIQAMPEVLVIEVREVQVMVLIIVVVIHLVQFVKRPEIMEAPGVMEV